MRIIAPETSPLFLRFFRTYARRYLRRHFHSVRLSRQSAAPPTDEQPCIIYLNHASWWDPLTCLFLAEKFFPHRPAFAPMDAEQFRRYRILGKLGLFPLESGSVGARRFLQIGRQILTQPAAMLWLTPQARFCDARDRPLRFARGLAYLALRSPQAQLIPLALEYVFWQERLPEILLRFGRGRSAQPLAHLSANEITNLLENDLASAMGGLAEDAITAEPSRFTPLLAGNEAISPVYDTARRIRARLRGESFRPAHSAASS